ncbi:uncharacterized protein FYW23_014638 [Sylvia borin]
MGSNISCSVEIQITNKTRNVTLKNPKTYFDRGQCAHSLLPELSPGSSGVCLSSGCGVAGLLVYETKSFTLAIYFSNPIDYTKFSMQLGLELSPGKAHLGRLVETYARMANGTYPSSDPDMKSSRAVVDKSPATVRVSHGPVKVTATMSNTSTSILEVMLEEEGGSRKEFGIEDIALAKIEKLLLKTHYQEK